MQGLENPVYLLGSPPRTRLFTRVHFVGKKIRAPNKMGQNRCQIWSNERYAPQWNHQSVQPQAQITWSTCTVTTNHKMPTQVAGPGITCIPRSLTGGVIEKQASRFPSHIIIIVLYCHPPHCSELSLSSMLPDVCRTLLRH